MQGDEKCRRFENTEFSHPGQAFAMRNLKGMDEK